MNGTVNVVEKLNSGNYEFSENEIRNLINSLKGNRFPSNDYGILFELLDEQEAAVKYEILFNIPPEQIMRYQDVDDLGKGIEENYGHFCIYEAFSFFLAYLYQHKDEHYAKRLLSKEFIAWQCVDASCRGYIRIPVNEQWELVKNLNWDWNENFIKNTDVSAKQEIFNYLRKEHYNELPDIANEKTVLINFFKLEELINFFPRIAQETLLELGNSQVIELIDYFVEKQLISCDQITKMFYVISNRENAKLPKCNYGSLNSEQFLKFITLCSQNVEYGKSKIELLKIYREKFEKWSNNNGNIPVLLEGINIDDIDK